MISHKTWKYTPTQSFRHRNHLDPILPWPVLVLWLQLMQGQSGHDMTLLSIGHLAREDGCSKKKKKLVIQKKHLFDPFWKNGRLVLDGLEIHETRCIDSMCISVDILKHYISISLKSWCFGSERNDDWVYQQPAVVQPVSSWTSGAIPAPPAPEFFEGSAWIPTEGGTTSTRRKALPTNVN